MAWRAMTSLLRLRDQVNIIAPQRSKVSDGLIGDLTHQASRSDHNPHPVAGVGLQMVAALDLTHDPAHGFDSYAFAEVLRINRDRRIKYVISNRRIFSAGTWTWRSYTGADPHVNHVHVSVLDASISDTGTAWNLEGLDDMTPGQQYVLHVVNWRVEAIIANRETYTVPAFTASDGTKFPAFTETNRLAVAVLAAGPTGATSASVAETVAAVKRALREGTAQ